MTAKGASSERPLEIAEQFVRVRVSTVSGMYRAGMPLCWAVLLMLHSYTGDGDGPWVSYPTARIAGSLGIAIGQVNNAVSYLKKKGILRTCEPGHNGSAAIYDLLLVADGPESIPTNVADGSESIPTSEGDESEQDGNSRSVSSITTYSQVASDSESLPKRTFKEGSFVEHSCLVYPSAPTPKEYHRPPGRKPREINPVREANDEKLG